MHREMIHGNNTYNNKTKILREIIEGNNID